jgi:hypothetical protein
MSIDGHRDRNEYIYILKVAREMGMTPQEISALKPEGVYEQSKMPNDEIERMIILYYLLFMMQIDGIITSEEERLVKDLGHQLGFRIDMVTDLIDVIKSHEQIESPSETLLDKIRAYLN